MMRDGDILAVARQGVWWMQTIPEAVLAIIALRRPDLRPLVDEVRLSPHTAADIEQRLASQAIRGIPLGETATLPG